MESSTSKKILRHIEDTLRGAHRLLDELLSEELEVHYKTGGDPVTVADRAVNDFLKRVLPGDGEGWLSEETTDDLSRLGRHRVWVVDPLDGTKEFVSRIPEWVVSVGLIEDGRAVAGGILNPTTQELFLGSQDLGLTYNGKPAQVSDTARLDGALVLASRSEVDRGEWDRFMGGGYIVRAMGSVAYKLARVAAGLADATWTLVPKHEWDVAAGAALVLAGGGTVYRPDGKPLTFNDRDPRLTGLVAHPPALLEDVRKELRRVAALGQPDD